MRAGQRFERIVVVAACVLAAVLALTGAAVTAPESSPDRISSNGGVGPGFGWD
jgi:hypothetical protein